jgi:acyl-CoA synthetase (AMP-forming)/AMP-acid ligase II
MGHGTALHDFVLARPGTVPRTSSGKVARTACRARYLAGVWASSIEADLTGAGEGE